LYFIILAEAGSQRFQLLRSRLSLSHDISVSYRCMISMNLSKVPLSCITLSSIS